MQTRAIAHGSRWRHGRHGSALGDVVMDVESLSREYPLDGVIVRALKGVSMSVRKGEFVAITGASGSGKSTMLGLIGCLDKPTAGFVRINGIDVNTLPDDVLARLRGREIGFVFQSFNLQPGLTAWENVALPMRIHEMPESVVHDTVDALLARVGMSDRKGHYPKQLSGGQQQRIAIARALSTSPAILLADEPTGNLDSEAGRAVLDLLAELNENDGVTIVVVTHEPTVFEYASRVVRLKDGLIE